MLEHTTGETVTGFTGTIYKVISKAYNYSGKVIYNLINTKTGEKLEVIDKDIYLLF